MNKLFSSMLLAAALTVTPAHGAEWFADGEYHMKMPTGQFQVRINGKSGMGRGKTYAEKKFRPWRKLKMTDRGAFIELEAYGYNVKVRKTSIKADSFRGTMVYDDRLRLGNHLYRRQ